MQFTTLFVSLLLSSTAMAKGNNSTKATSDKGLCLQMARLNATITLAANTTLLEAVTNNNATAIAEIQAKASTAATTLETMSANATLVQTCAVIASAEETSNNCRQMNFLQKEVEIAGNTTELDEITNNNATKAAEFQAMASKAATKLATMTSNTTLVAACSSIAASKAEAKSSNGNSTSKANSASSSASASAAAATTSSKSGASILNAGTGLVSTVVLVFGAVMVL